jgi:hypothetical protein
MIFPAPAIAIWASPAFPRRALHFGNADLTAGLTGAAEIIILPRHERP